MTNTAPPVETLTHSDWVELAESFPLVEQKPKTTVIEVQVAESIGPKAGGKLFEVDVFMQCDKDSVEQCLADWCNNKYGAMYSVVDYWTTKRPSQYPTDRYEDEF